MKVLRKIVGKTKIDRIRSQEIRESCGIQPINEWVERRRRRRRREWDEHVTRIDAEKSQGTIYLPEEDIQDVPKEDGATSSLFKTGRISYKEEEEEDFPRNNLPVIIILFDHHINGT